jgi:protein-S-isoprenylcysteine O-methyltransferase Ste14
MRAPQDKTDAADAATWIRRVLLWGDVAFYFGLLVLAVWIRPRTVALGGGVILASVAFPLWVLARIQLGSAFSFKAEARQLVTTGLYARIRHPVYVFGTLAGVGSLVALQVWPILALGLALTPITMLRSVREDRVLKAAFGAEYERYRAQAWF